MVDRTEELVGGLVRVLGDSSGARCRMGWLLCRRTRSSPTGVEAAVDAGEWEGEGPPPHLPLPPPPPAPTASAGRDLPALTTIKVYEALGWTKRVGTDAFFIDRDTVARLMEAGETPSAIIARSQELSRRLAGRKAK